MITIIGEKVAMDNDRILPPNLSVDIVEEETVSEDYLQKLTKLRIRALANERKLKMLGSKFELITKLIDKMKKYK